MTDKKPILIVDRETGKTFEEPVLGEKWIRWAYQDSKSGWMEKLFFRSAWFSKLMGRWYDSSFSRGRIQSAIDELHIDESEFACSKESFRSFNEFFVRYLKPEARPFSKDSNTIVSPAEGRVLVFPQLKGDTFVPVKGYNASIQKILHNRAKPFLNGALAIVRLCPADYHRYHFPCDGDILDYIDYSGALHSVNPIALANAKDVFGENKRSCTLIQSANAGKIAYVEVGAFGVGSIVNSVCSGTVKKMDEKGLFKFGGSTVILVFEPGKVAFSEDLLANSAAGKETLIKVGQPLAEVIGGEEKNP